MIILKGIKNLEGEVIDFTIASDEEVELECAGMTLLPALIDPHVHFRAPSGESPKEDWRTGAKAAIAGGITTVFDMPNHQPPCITLEALEEKKVTINAHLDAVEIPLRYGLYFGADRQHLDQIGLVKGKAVGIKIFMGSSTGSLLVDHQESLEAIFAEAAKTHQIVSVHSEDEAMIRQNAHLNEGDPSDHSRIRHRDAAIKSTERAIALAEKHGTRLVILHMSTAEELEMVKQAKARKVKVYAEVAPHHLLLNESHYSEWGTLVQMNPPLRTAHDNEALWRGIQEGTIDFIGTDHAPHTLDEKRQPYGSAPSGVPSVELLLPLMLNAVNEGKLNLERLVELTRTRIEDVFRLSDHEDYVVVDMNEERKVTNEQLFTKSGWSPYCGRTLKGWPVYTIASEKIFDLRRENCRRPLQLSQS